MLRTRKLEQEQWESVLPEALHCVRSLLCTSTNATPHERFFQFRRRSMFGRSLPSWLVTPGIVLLKKHNRNKYDSLCEEVELLHANPSYAHVRLSDGRETTVSTTELAPQGSSPSSKQAVDDNDGNQVLPSNGQNEHFTSTDSAPEQVPTFEVTPDSPPQISNEETVLRRSNRLRKTVDRYGTVPYV